MLVAGFSFPAHAQIVTDSLLRLVPGSRYAALAGQTWLFGSGHRRLWTDTIAVPRLDLRQTEGGVAPACSPPSLLSDDIRFTASDGSSWLFSSMDKPFAARYLPPSLYRSAAGRLVQDVVSSTHPAAPTIVPPLYQAVGIPYPDATLLALPATEDLTDYGGDIVERPGWWSPDLAAGNRHVPGLVDVVEIISTQELWQITKADGYIVDARAYLTSRLMDVLVGETAVDYNRIRWGRTADGPPSAWKPIPWDRGSAFASFDGLSRWYARFYVPALVEFEDTYPSIFGLVSQALVLDRRLLAGLELATWDSVATVIQTAMSDSLIDAAVARMPPEMYRREGPELAAALQARRDHLPEAAETFYRLLAEWVDVHATEPGADVEVRRVSEDRLAVTIRDPSRTGAAADTTPTFSRVFRADETREVRLYLDGERGGVTIVGEGRQRIRLRIVADDDGDAVHPSDAENTDVHQDAGGTEDLGAFDFGPMLGGHLTLHRTPRALANGCSPAPPAPAPDLRSPVRDWGSVWIPVPAVGYTSGLGVYVGAGVARSDYAFRQYPFKARHALWGGYASTPNSFFAAFYSDIRSVVGPFGVTLDARASGVGNPEYYGLGNETTNTQPESFYQIDQFQGVVAPLATLSPSPNTQVAAGVYYRASNTATGQGNIIDAQQPFGSGRVDDLGLTAWVKHDTYNDQIATPAGLVAGIGAHVGVAEGDSTFATVAADVLGFKSTDALPGSPTLILRLGGQVNWGGYPFYSAAFLGGTDNLKGFAPNRFGGDASLYLNSELRLYVAEISWPIYANFGVLGVADVGRVFLQGESSHKWHTGFGGGVWLGLLRTGQGLNLALVDGESLRLYISTGFIMKKKRFR